MQRDGRSLYQTLRGVGVTCAADGDLLVVDDPAGALSEEMWDLVKVNKPVLLAVIRDEAQQIRTACLEAARRRGWPAVKQCGRVTPWGRVDWQAFCRDGPLDVVARMAAFMAKGQ